jgi:hypothetical protein
MSTLPIPLYTVPVETARGEIAAVETRAEESIINDANISRR